MEYEGEERERDTTLVITHEDALDYYVASLASLTLFHSWA